MTNKIIDGISNALFNEFGECYEIYIESVEQGLKEPCFLISALSSTRNSYLNKRYYSTNKFLVQYFPTSKNSYAEINEVQNRLFNCLEYIEVANTNASNCDELSVIQGSEMQSERTDEMLIFFVSYNMFVHKARQQTFMEDLKIVQKSNDK